MRGGKAREKEIGLDKNVLTEFHCSYNKKH
jgi:hypothetical protein